jgi:Na+-driven multidrug efflux pump
MFSIMPAWGLANAAATLVGQSLGARKPERAEAAVWKAGHFNAVFLGSLSILYMVFAESIIGIFTQDATIIQEGSTCLRFFSGCYILYAYGMVLLQAFNGAGDTWTPTRINIVASWLVQLPLAWWLGVSMGLGPKGMYSAVPAGQIVFVSLSAYFFRRGSWKRTAI